MRQKGPQFKGARGERLAVECSGELVAPESREEMLELAMGGGRFRYAWADRAW